MAATPRVARHRRPASCGATCTGAGTEAARRKPADTRCSMKEFASIVLPVRSLPLPAACREAWIRSPSAATRSPSVATRRQHGSRQAEAGGQELCGLCSHRSVPLCDHLAAAYATATRPGNFVEAPRPIQPKAWSGEGNPLPVSKTTESAVGLFGGGATLNRVGPDPLASVVARRPDLHQFRNLHCSQDGGSFIQAARSVSRHSGPFCFRPCHREWPRSQRLCLPASPATPRHRSKHG